MRSLSNRRTRLIAVAALFCARVSLASVAIAQDLAGSPDSLRPDDISRALEIVRADPNLATEQTITTLHWKDSGEKPRSKMPAWLLWITGLFTWFGQSARILMWLAIATLAVLLLAFIVRLFGRRERVVGEAGFVAPTHVRDLDIRPQTLPDDIGAAARTLWDSGDHRASLALLYRGLLSRLAHAHDVPIRDSSTEGDCLSLTANHLAPERHEYVSRLVRVWQRTVYGCEHVETSTVYGLCDEFAFALASKSPLAAIASRSRS